MIKNSGLIILFMMIPITGPVLAKDFGTKGHIYRITEQPFLQMIDEKLRKVDIEKEREKMTSVVKDRVENPRAVEGLLPALNNRVFYFDPTYTLEEDAVLPCGKILHKAGTKVNPLEHTDLNRRLFFIDSRDGAQIKWLRKQLENPLNNEQNTDTALIEDRVILVGGSVLGLEKEVGKEHKEKIYFDQNGELTSRFGIKAVPATAVQEGLRLKIEEVNLTN